jgi:hypothetical protein
MTAHDHKAVSTERDVRTGSVLDYGFEALVRRAVKSAHVGRRRCVHWSHVSDAFALGSTYSIELCRHFGVDPHAQTGIEPDEDEAP